MKLAGDYYELLFCKAWTILDFKLWLDLFA
jgi:hypothetical protein